MEHDHLINPLWKMMRNIGKIEHLDIPSAYFTTENPYFRLG
jgi:hypothetical protein